ncbi:MAG: hypothetical protein ACK5V1_21760, partial [Planctomycetaceae bacterium]
MDNWGHLLHAQPLLKGLSISIGTDRSLRDRPVRFDGSSASTIWNSTSGLPGMEMHHPPEWC